MLVLAGQNKEAVSVLNAVADDVALAGNAAQAIALLKRVEALDPGRPDVEEKLAYYIRQRERPKGDDRAWMERKRAAQAIEFGMEEIADGGPAELEVVPPPPPLPDARSPGEAARPPRPAAPPKRVSLRPMPGAPAGAERRAAPPEPADAAPVASDASVEASAMPSAPPEPADDTTFLESLPDVGSAPEAAPPGTSAPLAADEIDSALRDELTALLEEVLSPADEPAEPASGGAAASPLFSDFSQAELVEVIRGLRLVGYEPGEIVVTEGEPGDSLYVIAQGSVRAWVRTPQGGSAQVRVLESGEFFGEISLLTGSARTATITAASHCEALVLDRPALDEIAARHPRVREVLQRFADQRAGSSVEAEIRARGASPPAR